MCQAFALVSLTLMRATVDGIASGRMANRTKHLGTRISVHSGSKREENSPNFAQDPVHPYQLRRLLCLRLREVLGHLADFEQAHEAGARTSRTARHVEARWMTSELGW